MKISRSFIEINLAILFLSTSGVFGRVIDMSPVMIIWWRCLLAGAVLWIYIRWTGKLLGMKQGGDGKLILLSGLLMAAHWVSYFYSLHLSNVAIAMLTLHAYPAMTVILEPLILRTRFSRFHLFLSVLVLLGIAILVPEPELTNNITLAVICGLVSALAYALRNIYTRKVINRYDGSVMMFYQLLIMAVVLLPVFYFEPATGILTEWPFVVLLAVVTTCMGHTLFVHNLKSYNAATISLLTSIVPVYGVLWALLFLGEVPGVNTIIGGGIILASFILAGRFSR